MMGGIMGGSFFTRPEAPRNTGFLVQYDRFLLTDPTRYVLKGYIVPDTEMAVSADTVAMSQPHLIEYTLCFDGSTLQ